MRDERPVRQRRVLRRRDLQAPPSHLHAYKQWKFKSKAPGLQQVVLKDKGTGQLLLTVKAKKWFAAGAANQAADATTLTVTIGGQCLSHVVTKKSD